MSLGAGDGDGDSLAEGGGGRGVKHSLLPSLREKPWTSLKTTFSIGSAKVESFITWT